MLTLTVEGTAGANIREYLIPQMIRLATVTVCYVEMNANGTVWRFGPNDTVEAAQDAFDRLYPESRLVMTGMVKPWKKDDAS